MSKKTKGLLKKRPHKKMNGCHIINGQMWHYVEGKLHREDGPAQVDITGDGKSWWYNGEKLDCTTQEEFETLLKLKAFW